VPRRKEPSKSAEKIERSSLATAKLNKEPYPSSRKLRSNARKKHSSKPHLRRRMLRAAKRARKVLMSGKMWRKTFHMSSLRNSWKT
jgi:hypothetical protein